MIINRVQKQEEDGTYTAALVLTEEQLRFLLQFAIGALTQQGIVKVFDLKEGEQPKTEDDEEARQFLERVDPAKMGQA